MTSGSLDLKGRELEGDLQALRIKGAEVHSPEIFQKGDFSGGR